MNRITTFTLLGSILLAAPSALAENLGSIEVDCQGSCDTVLLGEICDIFTPDSSPFDVICSHRTPLGGWRPYDCGVATCVREFDRSDTLADYCDDGPGADAIVTCKASSE